jgi:hypothetical protein
MTAAAACLTTVVQYAFSQEHEVGVKWKVQRG